MSAERDAMLAAVTATEAAVQQLATAYANYAAAFRVAAQTVYSATPDARASTAASELAGAVGPELVALAASGRLFALGAERVLVSQPGALTPRGPEWVAWLTGQIQHHVP